MTDQLPNVTAPTSQGGKLAETTALGLLGIEGVIILGYVAAGIANQVTFGSDQLSGFSSHAWGYTLSLASGWSAPPAVAVFLIAPLVAVVWMQRYGDGPRSATQSVLILRLVVCLAALTIAGGIVSIVGRVLQLSPSENWSSFFVTLGTGIGSVGLGVMGVVAVGLLAGGVSSLWDR